MTTPSQQAQPRSQMSPNAHLLEKINSAVSKSTHSDQSAAQTRDTRNLAGDLKSLLEQTLRKNTTRVGRQANTDIQ